MMPTPLFALRPVAPKAFRATGPLLAAALLLVCGAAAQAQAVYRIVGPDGKVTFSDRPPSSASAERGASTLQPGGGGAASGATLPYELAQVVARYPVTLYSANDCAPCNAARGLLSTRGVPFNERTVNSVEDVAAFQRLSSDGSLPFATIGAQKLSGFSDVEWTQYLDAAGYPKQSQLPANYRRAPATPLVAAKPPPAPAAPPASAAPASPDPVVPAAPAPAPSNPAGISF